MQQSLFSKSEEKNISLEDVFTAYFDCRKNKRNKLDALEFELDFEKELVKLWKEINNKTYKISPLDVFISDKPVKREIFAAQFRDRIVHHLIINKMEHLFEKEFIYDTYSCRKEKGTHFGIKRVKRFIRQCSENYKKDCYILKMDIRGYFMSVNNSILFGKLEQFINRDYKEKDREKIIWAFRQVIEHNPIKTCKRKSSKRKWEGLPKSKSLFYAKPSCGMPIGNYTNQVLANFYLSSFDHFVKHELGMKYYARYVDDFIVISKKKERLKEIVPQMRDFLRKELEVEIHPRKIYFQHYKNGVEFLGVLIKPNRSYISSRVKGSFFEAVIGINRRLLKNKKLSDEEKNNIISQINSYLGATKHSNAYNLRKKFLMSLGWRFWGYFKTEDSLSKITLNKEKEKRKSNRPSKEKRRKRKEIKKKNITIWRINMELNFINYHLI